MPNGIEVEDRMEGARNFSSWKIRIIALLEELELESFIEQDLKMPERTTWNRRNRKAKKIIIDAVRDHILPSIARLKTAYEVFKPIKDTFETNNASGILTLKQQLMNINIKKRK